MINCDVVTNGSTSISKAIGFVEMATEQEARRAIVQLNGKELAERVKRSCVDLASEMQCPHHFKHAKVEMDGENLNDFSMDVITCCEEFRRRFEEALDKLVPHRV